MYCYNLSRELRGTDDVRVFHVSNAQRRWRRQLRRETYGGLPTYHCIDGAEYARVADWPNAFLRTAFQTVLDELHPEIVHVHNYVSLGDDLVSMAHASGARVVYTLHDFGLICPNTLLLRDDGQLCAKDHPNFFSDCCPTLIRTNGHERRAAPWVARVPSLARWRLFSRQHPHPLVRSMLLAGTVRAERWFGNPIATNVSRKRDFFFTQTRRIFRDVHLFIAPSDFLRRRYIACGVPAEKIVHVPYGMRGFSVPARAPRRGGVRFGYIGALHSHKGIELLLEAFRGLGDRASLHVHGSDFGSPISRSYWQRIRDDDAASVTFHGEYDNDRVGSILANLDIIVVPSTWYENAPLTIQEAFIARVPVITANAGGMAELVRDGVNGLHFRLGDAADLREKLRTVIERPELCEHLRAGIAPVTSIEAHAADLRERYRRLINE